MHDDNYLHSQFLLHRSFCTTAMRHDLRYWLILIVIIIDRLNRIDAKILSGQLITNQNWAFLARFCFLSEKGRFQYDFVIPDKDAEVNLLLYYDSETQWPSVYPSNKTCSQKESVLRRDRGQIVSLSPHSTYVETSGCFFTTNNQSEIRCQSYREFRSQRPRWWFIALSDCHSEQRLNVSYWISLTNGEPGDFWSQHFSADEFYILPELLIGAVVYTILIGFSIYVAIQLRTRRLLHVTYKLFMLSLTTQLCGILLEINSYINLALYGFDLQRVYVIGMLFESFSETCFTALLLLMSLGYTVTKSLITPSQSWRLSIFIGFMISLQILIFLYQAEVFDPGLVLYLYESPPGYLLLILKLWAWVIFVLCCYQTGHIAAAKFHFYGSLLSLGSGWFLCQPITVMAMTFIVDKWIRESVVKGLSLWVVFVGHAMFLYVTRPSTANSNFPFHIRTFQVVPVEGQGHSYEPNNLSQMSVTHLHLPRSPPVVSTIS